MMQGEPSSRISHLGALLSSPSPRASILTIAPCHIVDNAERFQEALKADLGRPVFESNFLEIFPVTTEATLAYKRVESWAKPESVPFDFNTFALSPKVVKDPQGVVLIIGPFNYPLVSPAPPPPSTLFQTSLTDLCSSGLVPFPF